MADRNRGKPPRAKGKGKRPLNKPSSAGSANDATPKFCLAHIVDGHCVESLPDDNKRADFALALQKRCSMTWQQITFADKHGLGLEMIDAGAIKPTVPESFSDREKFTVMRYSGLLPMVGVRVVDTFHILWIEGDFGDVYDHG